jgi:hypothetical protein
MATHDYVIANGSGAAVRADLNDALAAIVTGNSNATAPTTTYAYEPWFDTSTSPATIKRRDGSNASWITIGYADGSIDLGSAATPTIRFNGDTNTGIYSPGADQVAISTGGTQRATVDSSGRLLVGTSTAAGDAKLQIQGDSTSSTARGLLSLLVGSSSPADGAGLGRINFTDSAGAVGAALTAARDGGTWSASSAPSRLVFATSPDGAISPTEAMRITSDGRVLFGTTGTPSASVTGAAFTPQTNGRMSLFSSTSSTASQKHVLFFNPNGEVGSISTNASATAYTTSSDYRLKENIIPLTGASERVLQLKPSRFNFIADPDIQVDGFIAHEAQAVVPECVTGEKDEVDEDGNPVYQGIDQSKLVPLLTAALQEALAEIESLKARLTAAGI